MNSPPISTSSDWSLLPIELLQEIASHLDSSIYTVRFRSVCSAWRSAVDPPHRFLSPHPISATNSFAAQFGGFSLSKRSIFLLSPPNPNPNHNPNSDPISNPWMIKTEEIAPAGTFRLFNPIVRTHVDGIPHSFPRIFDVNDVRVRELGQEYVLKFVNHVLGRDYHSLYMEKVAFLSKNGGVNYVILTIHISGKLAVFRSGDDKWVIVNDMQSPYDDVIVFDGDFYGVDGTGRMVKVEIEGEGSGGEMEVKRLTLVAKPIFGGDKKCLVKSGGDLLLVDMYNGVPHDEESDEEMEEDEDDNLDRMDEYMRSNTLWFEVFRLDKNGQQWVRVDRLDDRVLFLDDNCAFSASVSELCWSGGNCIWYNFTANTNSPHGSEDDPLMCSDIKVFELENSCTSALQEFGSSSRLFWPPPPWIKSSV